MDIAELTIDGVLLLAMIAASVYGAVNLPARTQVPIHFGLRAYNNWVPKWVGLLVWPGTGVVISVLLVLTVRAGQTNAGSTISIVLPIALAIMLVAQLGALKVAGSESIHR
ncbi:MAG: hypothetical protein ACRDQA_16550 [Nocardioidaceae bacterium]